MSKLNKYTFLFLSAWLPVLLFGQPCQLQISGNILDPNSGEFLENARITVQENGRTYASDSKGMFTINNLCPGEYHITFSHLGCVPEKTFFNLKNDTSVVIFMHHHSELINEVEVHGQHEESAQASSAINEEEILSLANKNLSQTLEDMTGVSTINNGAGISKPVIHGLYGNRVGIMNNGIAQSGQQWGIDHAPEIDPFVANHISVIKGASALAYNSTSLGGIVLVEPAPLGNEPHLHGKANYVYQTNGRGNTANLQLEKSARWGSWRINGTAKYIGDRKSPNYFLTNTGNRELDVAGAYEKNLSARWKLNIYYSIFSTEIGILRGSHISNSTDLASALERDEPFFTNDYFSYNIAAPRQKVRHQLLKVQSKYMLNEHQFIALTYGGQLNNRDEFDVRRGNLKDDPSLSLAQITHFIEGKYSLHMPKNWELNTGVQYNYVDNTNDNSSTGRLPLIPDYRSNQLSGFAILQKTHDKLFYEFGARADVKNLEVVEIANTVPRTIQRHDHLFSNTALSAGARYTFSESIALNFDAGYVQRAPEVNELYSSGLHQGLASVEYGNPNLDSEKSFKTLLGADFNLNKKVFIQVLGYFQNINDYIFLKPTGQFELNISGSFPIFIYDQTDAQIFGFDALTSYQPTQHIKLVAKFAYIKGINVTEDLPLIYMPSNNLLLTANYAFDNKGKWQNNSISVSGKFVAKQKDILPEQDFLAPPDAYFLLGASAKTTWVFTATSLDFGLRVENALNSVYRDYLNRQRYFADDLGINVSMRVTYNF